MSIMDWKHTDLITNSRRTVGDKPTDDTRMQRGDGRWRSSATGECRPIGPKHTNYVHIDARALRANLCGPSRALVDRDLPQPSGWVCAGACSAGCSLALAGCRLTITPVRNSLACLSYAQALILYPSTVPTETALYELLGVLPDATDEEIKKAYRRKAREHHPDKNPDDPEAGKRFQEMAAAYEILSSVETREMYDRYGMGGLSGPGGGHGPDIDPNDILSELFGGGFHFGFDFGPHGPGGRRRARGEDTVIKHDVTLEDVYNGKSIKMTLEKEIVCGACKGSGARGSAKPKQCVKCEGKGFTMVQVPMSSGRYGVRRSVCTECDGQGEKLREKDRCKKCKGHKTVKEKTRQEIFVERGMADGQRIVLSGAGDEEPGVPPGDVIFVFKTRPHPFFERKGNDLLTKVHVTLSEALLGFSRILLTHLDGRGIHVTSPKGKILKPGDSIVIRGEGMPLHKNPDQKGHLYVVFEVDFPEEDWLKTVDVQALEVLLPAKKPEIDPKPAVIDEVPFEESDFVDFGDDEDEWEDEEDEDEDGEPECRTQ